MSRSPEVRLADVDEPMLERLLDLATCDALPDDVTPPLGAGTGWNAERIGWFRRLSPVCIRGLGRSSLGKELGRALRRQPGRLDQAQRYCRPNSGDGHLTNYTYAGQSNTERLTAGSTSLVSPIPRGSGQGETPSVDSEISRIS